MTHHAYYIEGPLSLFDEYKAELEPFWANQYERFGVDDARALQQLAGLKNYKESLFFIAVSAITTEAQQALLKLLEEPQGGTTFIFLVPHGALISTVRSRMLPYPHVFEQGLTLLKKEAGEFLKASQKGRSDYIAKLLKDEEGVRERVREFVNALETLLLKKIKEKEARAGLEDITKVRSYLGDRSPSLKMLLEHLALVLPKV